MPGDARPVIAANLARIRPEIGAGAEILAATKYVDADGMEALAEAGVTLVGENRTDALAAKQERFAERFTWDFIGHLQSRKVRDVVGRVRLIHAVDSVSVCSQIEARAAAARRLPAPGEHRRRGLEGRR